MIWIARFAIGGIALYVWFRDGYYWVMGRVYRKKVWRQVEQAIELEKSRMAHPSHHMEPPLEIVEDWTVWDEDANDDWPIHGEDWRSHYLQDPDNGPDR